jgi:hypothetical protein
MPGSWSDYLELRTGDAPPPSPEDGDVRVYADGGGDLRAVQSDGTDAPIGGGGLPDPFVVIGTDPDTQTARIEAPVDQGGQTIFECDVSDGVGGHTATFTIGGPGGSGMQFSPNPNNSTSVQFLDNGQVIFKDADGNESFKYNGSTRLDLDPRNGQVSVLQEAGKGFLRLAASSEPADADLSFNGCFIFYIDGNDLKAKAKIGGSFLHLTVGTFA